MFLWIDRGIVWSAARIRHILWFMDRLTPERRSWLMSRVRGSDTGPERIVRGLVRQLGFRPKLNAAGLPGKPDLAFPKRKKAIFVHGCFWHRHGAKTCDRARMPKSKRAFWIAKLDANRRRDRRDRTALKRLGWTSFVVWECQLDRPERVGARLARYLG
ncbi:MAG: very short patch repair endonuclease [Tagaea sp.]|nr:very short patch repair endonuclease [Tagaea sp.]